MKLLSIAACAATLTACGQTGDLYLPESRQGTVVTRPTPVDTHTPPQPTPAPEVPPPPGTKDKKNGKSK